MDGEDESSAAHQGPVTCAAWIRRPDNLHLVIFGRSRNFASPPILEIFSFDPKTISLSPDPMARFVIREEGGNPLGFAVHPNGDEIVCSTANGCKFIKLIDEGTWSRIRKTREAVYKLTQVDEVTSNNRASKQHVGADHSLNFLDSEFLASTSTDGSARRRKINDGVPLISFTRNSDEKIECCRFSRDGTKPLLFCTVQKGGKVVIAVWDISTWKKIGHKRLLRKPTSVLSVSLDGKYLAFCPLSTRHDTPLSIQCGTQTGVSKIMSACMCQVAMVETCVVEAKKMEVSHWSKKLHLGTCISSIEFCPSERVVISFSHQWGAMVTKLSVPADWKEWQIY